MYCPDCPVRLEKALSYCNHCEASLRALKSFDKASPPEASIDRVIYLILGTTVTILGMCLGPLVLMTEKRVDFALGALFVTLSFLALVLVDGLLVWRVVRLTRGAKGIPGAVDTRNLKTEQQGEETYPLLEPADPMPSITEQTTRTFEPSYRGDEKL